MLKFRRCLFQVVLYADVSRVLLEKSKVTTDMRKSSHKTLEERTVADDRFELFAESCDSLVVYCGGDNLRGNTVGAESFQQGTVHYICYRYEKKAVH